jgi:hypothetical protein
MVDMSYILKNRLFTQNVFVGTGVTLKIAGGAYTTPSLQLISAIYGI